MTPTLIPPALLPLTAADRCDRCGARATTRVILDSGSDLLFCGHHTRQYDATITAVAAEVISES